ncbi:MAG TPA: RNA methyltransferase, partial [Orrella sp.]
MKKITSNSNTLYKSWQRLARQGGADRQSLVLEGVHLCRAWLTRFGQPQWAIFRQDDEVNGEVAALVDAVPQVNQAWLHPRL